MKIDVELMTDYLKVVFVIFMSYAWVGVLFLLAWKILES